MKGAYSVMHECMTKAIKAKNIKGCFPFPNRPFPSSAQSLFQNESKCQIFVMIISSNFQINEN